MQNIMRSYNEVDDRPPFHLKVFPYYNLVNVSFYNKWVGGSYTITNPTELESYLKKDS